MNAAAPVELRVEGAGPDAPPVVFVHGGAVDSRVWDAAVDRIARRRRCVRYDRRGLGRSRDLSGGSHTADLVDVLDRTDRPAHLVASSVGAAIALDAAMVRPDRIARLCLIGPLVVGHAPSADTIRRLDELRRAARAGGDALADAFVADPTALGPSPPPDAIARLRAVVAANREVWLGDSSTDGPRAVIDRLRQVAAPTRVLLGEADGDDNRAMAALVAREIRGAELRVVSGAGHLVELTHPDAVARAVLDG